MSTQSILTTLNYEEYLLRLYFGPGKDLLLACINRAYLDFSRTLHGLSEVETKDVLHEEAINALRDALTKLKMLSDSELTETKFDDWHKETCQMLISIYRKHNYDFLVGQAQKWVNMTLKYIFTFGEKRIASFGKAYPYCHIPLDNIILGQLANYGFPKIQSTWSRIADYNEYLKRQIWVRQTFVLVPLDTEFLLWLGEGVKTKSQQAQTQL